MDYVKLYVGSSILVNRLAFLLDEKAIPSIIKDNQQAGRLAGFGTTGDAVELHVREKDFKKATTVLDLFNKEISK